MYIHIYIYVLYLLDVADPPRNANTYALFEDAPRMEDKRFQ